MNKKTRKALSDKLVSALQLLSEVEAELVEVDNEKHEWAGLAEEALGHAMEYAEEANTVLSSEEG